MSFFTNVVAQPAQAEVVVAYGVCGGCGRQSAREEFNGNSCKCGRPLHSPCVFEGDDDGDYGRYERHTQCVLCEAIEMNEKTEKSISRIKDEKRCSYCRQISDTMIVCDEFCMCNCSLPRKDGTHNYRQFCSKMCAHKGGLFCLNAKGVERFFCKLSIPDCYEDRTNLFYCPIKFGFIKLGDKYYQYDRFFEIFGVKRYSSYQNVPEDYRKYLVPLIDEKSQVCTVCKGESPNYYCECCGESIHIKCGRSKSADKIQFYVCTNAGCQRFICEVCENVNTFLVIKKWKTLEELYTTGIQRNAIKKRFNIS